MWRNEGKKGRECEEGKMRKTSGEWRKRNNLKEYEFDEEGGNEEGKKQRK